MQKVFKKHVQGKHIFPIFPQRKRSFCVQLDQISPPALHPPFVVEHVLTHQNDFDMPEITGGPGQPGPLESPQPNIVPESRFTCT